MGTINRYDLLKRMGRLCPAWIPAEALLDRQRCQAIASQKHHAANDPRAIALGISGTHTDRI